MTIFHAWLETTNFQFDAYGATPGEALAALRRGWVKHRRQYQATDTWADVEESVQCAAVGLGECWRDHERLTVAR